MCTLRVFMMLQVTTNGPLEVKTIEEVRKEPLGLPGECRLLCLHEPHDPRSCGRQHRDILTP